MTILFKTVLSMSIGAGVLGLMVLIARAIVGRRQTVAPDADVCSAYCKACCADQHRE